MREEIERMITQRSNGHNGFKVFMGKAEGGSRAEPWRMPIATKREKELSREAVRKTRGNPGEHGATQVEGNVME